MKRHKNHQIDERARHVFQEGLPPSWVLNEQLRDYAKDYLVEIGDDDTELTGNSFYVQLKGQETPALSRDGKLVKFYLKSKYARYYFDRIRDLPVFLVLIDVTRKKGWWLFLQPVLEADESWRKKDSIAILLPITNAVADTAGFRQSVENAKKWMRLHHPESIHETVVAHKERILRIDPRFDVAVSLVNDKPHFSLIAKEDVPITFEFAGDHEKIKEKVSDLIEKGVKVAFEPGEVRAKGSKLFEPLDGIGFEMQWEVHKKCAITLVCEGAQGQELARLIEIPGQLRGGQKELWLESDLSNSPLSVTLGPLAAGLGGSLKLSMKLGRWDGQRLLQLAYFARLHDFFGALPKSTVVSIQCEQDGNKLFSIPLPLQTPLSFAPLSHYFQMIHKARRVVERVSANPVWTTTAFDQDAMDTIDHLHGVFFDGGWVRPTPTVQIKAECVKAGFRHDLVELAPRREDITLVSDETASLLGEQFEIGRMSRHFSQVLLTVRNGVNGARRRKTARAGNKSQATTKRRPSSTLSLVIKGTDSTIMTVRMATAGDRCNAGGDRGNVR